jgi:hypothetical protein
MRRIAAAGSRCAGSGAEFAHELRRIAAELRQEHRASALAKVHRSGTWSLLPLGLCFLPAFICLGVVPVIAGIAGQIGSA